MAPLPITDALIRQHSTPESFERGQRYYHGGAVGALVRRGDVLQAEVMGSAPVPYDVSVVVDEAGGIAATCTCPYDWGGWCKHIVAALLAAVHMPEAIEDRMPLPELLAPLDRDTLQHLLLRLAAADSILAARIEAELGLLSQTAAATATGSGAPTAPEPRAAVSVTALRRELRTLLRGSRRGYDDDYWSVGSIAGPVDDLLQSVWPLIHAGTGRAALPLLAAITEEVWSGYDELDDSDGEGVPLFAGIGDAWAEALLSPDMTTQERERWGAQLEGWRDELADYGLEEGFEAAVLAAAQGWDDPLLVRVLRGEETRASLWDAEAGPPEGLDNAALAQAQLHVLERAERWDEYLRLADATGQVTAYTTALVHRGRVDEAVAYGLAHLGTPQEAQALAQALQERAEPWRALEIAEAGLRLEGMKAPLADWTAALAVGLGETARALAAAEVGFREAPTLEEYRRVQELAGAAWPTRRAALLAYLRGLSGYLSYTMGPVEIFLHDGLIDDAIAAVDRVGGHRLLEQVADAALPTHPTWVIATSRREAEAIMDRGKSEAYDVAARWVARVRDAYRAAGREVEWQAYRAQLLSVHGRKYRLVPLLKAL